MEGLKMDLSKEDKGILYSTIRNLFFGDENFEIIMLAPFGSHLYGTSTPSSDLDFKGIFIPPLDDILLCRVPKTCSFKSKRNKTCKNDSSDIEVELYSIYHFFHDALEGETVALDMLHTPNELLIKNSYIWKDIVDNRRGFYTRNLKSFISYSRKQAAKYGIKGSRLSDGRRVLDFLRSIDKADSRLRDHWDHLPEGEHIHRYDDTSLLKNDVRLYEVCGIKLQETSTIDHSIPIIEHFVYRYGERAQLAEKNEGVDWKAISHAFRAAYQARDIFLYGDITYPLKEADFLRDVKLGKFHYLNDHIGSKLDEIVQDVESLSNNSDLPEKANRKFWDKFLLVRMKKCFTL